MDAGIRRHVGTAWFCYSIHTSKSLMLSCINLALTHVPGMICLQSMCEYPWRHAFNSFPGFAVGSCFGSIVAFTILNN